jgi:hypothetical protein
VEEYLRAGQTTDDNTVMHFACWIPKVSNTRSKYAILAALPLQQWLHKYMSVEHYMYIACLLLQKTSLQILLNAELYFSVGVQ